jgi:hypothetical protein
MPNNFRLLITDAQVHAALPAFDGGAGRPLLQTRIFGCSRVQDWRAGAGWSLVFTVRDSEW